MIGCCQFHGGNAVVELWFIVARICMGFCVWSLACDVVLSVLSSLAVSLLTKRELFALL